MFRWNAEVRCEDTENWGHFLFRDLSDSEIIVLGEMAERSGNKVSVKFWAEKEAPEDVAHIGGMDEEES